MSTTIDPNNTTQWQQTGNSIYLLEENDRSTANAFSVTVVKYHSSNNQTDPKEIASKICSFLNNESVGVDPKVRLEMVFQSIVNICDKATGGNAAFGPKYGLRILNDIRRKLDLDIVNTGSEQQDIKKMEELLGWFWQPSYPEHWTYPKLTVGGWVSFKELYLIFPNFFQKIVLAFFYRCR